MWPLGLDAKAKLETLHQEFQALSEKLLSLLAMALRKEPSIFDTYLEDSMSTLRMLHYPAIEPPAPQQEFCCTPHTDSSILTLLHHDKTGGLEVLSADDQWIRAPYVSKSIVVNIGDLVSRISGGKFKATRHRVWSLPGKKYSVPFFSEPGAACLVKTVDDEHDQGVLYGKHVLEKMSGWVEFQVVAKSAVVVEGVEEIVVDA